MSVAKKVFVGEVIAWHSQLLSVSTTDFSISPKRASINSSAHADLADTYAKGAHQAAATAKGSSLDAEAAVLAALANTGALYPYTWLPASSAVAVPAAQQGDPAIFCATMVPESKLPAQRNVLHEWELTAQPQTQVYAGKVVACSINQPYTASGTRTPGINLGALTAGHILAGAIHVLYPPGVFGTTPSYTPLWRTGASGAFASPVTRHASAAFIAPGSEYFEIDGDVTPISDPWWRIEDAIAGTALPSFPVLAVLAIGVKP